jgi:Ca2+/Na+ antiporter
MTIHSFPELAFLIIVVLFFMVTDFILTVVSVMSIYTHCSHVLIGITVISWGSSAIEMINLTIASKKGEMQLGLTSILSAIVMTYLIIMPLGFVFKMIRRNSHEIDVLQLHHSSN